MNALLATKLWSMTDTVTPVLSAFLSISLHS